MIQVVDSLLNFTAIHLLFKTHTNGLLYPVLRQSVSQVFT